MLQSLFKPYPENFTEDDSESRLDGPIDGGPDAAQEDETTLWGVELPDSHHAEMLLKLLLVFVFILKFREKDNCG